MVKNEMDIIESFVRHTLGFADLLIVADHKSTDRTREILEALKEEGLPLIIEDVAQARHVQAETMTHLLWEAADDDAADLILPLDADEFLLPVHASSLRTILEQLPTDDVRTICLRQYGLRKPLPEGRFLLDVPLCCSSELAPMRRITVGGDFVRQEHMPIVEGSHGVLRKRGKRQEIYSGEIFDKVEVAHFPKRSAAQMRSKYAVGWPNIVAKYTMNTMTGGFYRETFERVEKGDNFETWEEDMAPCDLHGCVPMPELRYSQGTTPDAFRNLMAASVALAEELAETRAFAEKPYVTTILPYTTGGVCVIEIDSFAQRWILHAPKIIHGMKFSYRSLAMGCQMNWQQKSQRRVHVFLRFRKMF